MTGDAQVAKKVAVYTHHTGRFLGKISISEEQAELLRKPPELTPVVAEDGKKTYRGEDHVVSVSTTQGLVRLFKVTVSGVERIVTLDHSSVAAGQ